MAMINNQRVTNPSTLPFPSPWVCSTRCISLSCSSRLSSSRWRKLGQLWLLSSRCSTRVASCNSFRWSCWDSHCSRSRTSTFHGPFRGGGWGCLEGGEICESLSEAVWVPMVFDVFGRLGRILWLLRLVTSVETNISESKTIWNATLLATPFPCQIQVPKFANFSAQFRGTYIPTKIKETQISGETICGILRPHPPPAVAVDPAAPAGHATHRPSRPAHPARPACRLCWAWPGRAWRGPARTPAAGSEAAGPGQ